MSENKSNNPEEKEEIPKNQPLEEKIYILPEKHIISEKRAPEKRKYMVPVVMAIIGLPLLFQIIIHESALENIYDSFGSVHMLTALIHYFLYAFIYSSISSILIAYIYHRIEMQKTRKIREISIITYLIMLTVVYIVPLIRLGSGSGLTGLWYIIIGIFIAPIIIIKNAIVFFVIMLIWHNIKKHTEYY